MTVPRSAKDWILEQGLLVVMRVDQSTQIQPTVDALRDGGVQCIEIAMTTPGALDGISEAASRHGDLLMGAGTILDGPTARLAILAGARFLVTPTVEPDVIEVARSYGTATLIGAMTPSEMMTAWRMGADLVKVFPAEVLGTGFLKAVRGPLPRMPIVPTGGITADNAADFLRAGAVAVCSGGWVVDRASIRAGNYTEIISRARKLVESVRRGSSRATS